MGDLRRWLFALAMCAAGLSFCGRSGAPDRSDIQLSLSSAALKLAPGQSGQVTVTVRATAALPGPVVLTMRSAGGAALPDGVSFAFEPPQLSVEEKGEQQTRLRVALLPDALVDDYALEVYGRSADREESAKLTISVTGASTTWQRQIGTPGTDILSAIAVDKAGNLYVAGYTTAAFGGQVNAGNFDGFLLKYHADGGLEWAAPLRTSGSDIIAALAVDGEDNVYLAGYTYGAFPGFMPLGSADALLAKFSPSGQQLWLQQFGTDQIDQLFGVTVDPKGEVYVVGITEGSFPGQSNAGVADMLVMKFHADGQKAWLQQFGTDQPERAGGIAADGNGIYIVGGTQGALPSFSAFGLTDGVIARYQEDGTQTWLRQFGTPGEDLLQAVTLDDAGALYVAGSTRGVFPGQIQYGGTDALLLKYQPDGTRVYGKQFGTSYTDSLNAVRFVGGRIYTAGATRGSFPGQLQAGAQDAFIAWHNKDGGPEWMWQFGSNQSDYASAIASKDDTLYFGGVVFGALPKEYAEGDSDGFIIQSKVH